MNSSSALRRGLSAARPAAFVQATNSTQIAARRYLIVDLNNFASFPTLAIGLLTASLRDKGHVVDVLSPLAHDVPAVLRERQETLYDHVKRRVHLSDTAPGALVRRTLGLMQTRRSERPHRLVLRAVLRALDQKPDAILLSAYLQHYRTVRHIAALARGRGIPVVVGGPMFNIEEVAQTWRQLPGVALVVGREVELDLADILTSLLDGGDLGALDGITLPNGWSTSPARPLRPLDATPMADFTDFPWDRYPVRIVPIMAGRGCQWDKCLFCSDVISVSGRTFRTRSLPHVLAEMQHQAHRHATTNFLFLDLKLNSWPDMIRGIARDLGRYVQGAEWVGTVHVDQRADNGLSPADLHAAVEGGMRRVSFGLESGSQRLLDAMHKGSSVERNAGFIRDAHAAGLSIRCTMFKGFPGETAQDMEMTANFLEEHADYLDRVRFNDFTVHTGTPIWRMMTEKAGAAASLQITATHDQRGRSSYRRVEPVTREYRRAKARALDIVFAINSRPVRDAARQFDGLM